MNQPLKQVNIWDRLLCPSSLIFLEELLKLKMEVHKIVQKNQASVEMSYFLMFPLFLCVLSTD